MDAEVSGHLHPPDFRGHGLERRLTAEARQRSSRPGRCFLRAFRTNHAAIALYEQLVVRQLC